jgi:hypothetical protein
MLSNILENLKSEPNFGVQEQMKKNTGLILSFK